MPSKNKTARMAVTTRAISFFTQAARPGERIQTLPPYTKAAALQGVSMKTSTLKVRAGRMNLSRLHPDTAKQIRQGWKEIDDAGSEEISRALRIIELIWGKPMSQGLRITGKSFREAMDAECDEKECATKAQQFLWVWEAEGEEVQAKLLNGWRDCGKYPRIEDVKEMVGTLHPVMRVDCNDRSMDVYPDFFMNDGRENVTIHIAMGTPVCEAIAKLRAAANLLESRWGEFVALAQARKGFSGGHINVSAYELAAGMRRTWDPIYNGTE
jgi:hypothetical protein